MEIENKQDLYSLPFEKTLKMKLPIQIITLFVVVSLVAAVSFITQDYYGLERFLANVFFIFSALYLFYHWLSVAVLKKARLILTEDYIEFADGFGKKVFKWEELESVKIESYRGNAFFGIKERNKKKTFWTSIAHFFRDAFAIKIPFSLLGDTDLEKLYLTISWQIEKNNVLFKKSYGDEKRGEKISAEKRGNYYIRRRNGVIDVFLIDTGDYLAQERKFLYTITKGCLIAKDGENIGAFYLPKKRIDELGINMENGSIETVNFKEYYKIEPDGAGSSGLYNCSCLLWCNLAKQVELISIQI